MRKYKIIFLLVAVTLMASSCAALSKHGHSRGSVVLSDEGQEAHVCLGGDEVKIGDKVDVFEVTCTTERRVSVRRPRSFTKCGKAIRGQAEVIYISDKHYSKIKSLGNLVLKEGLIVEKTQN